MNRGQGWFVVLPDSAQAASAAGILGAQAGLEVESHRSGRPWLVGQWSQDELTVTAAGSGRVALIGDHPPLAPHRAESLRRIRSADELERIAAGIPGCFHLVSSLGGRVRVRGTASGMRRIYYARAGGVTVGCDRADVLAQAVGGTLDEDALLLRLLEPAVPHPFGGRPLWREVSAVPEGHCLELDPEGGRRVARWWYPPEPCVSLEEGAPKFAEALAEAVAVRTAAGTVVSADLSGGLDSTPVCFLAARGPAKLVMFTQAGIDAGHEDALWARRAAAHLPDAEHLEMEPGRMPAFYTGLLTAGQGFDEPALGGRIRGTHTALARMMAAKGSRLHLTGEGGDQVVQALDSYVHDTLRTHPRAGLRHLRALSAECRWSPGAAIRAAADRRSYRRWLTDAAAGMGPMRLSDRTPAFMGWDMPPTLPPWITAEARERLRHLIRHESGAVIPLAPTRGRHMALAQIISSTRMCRQIARFTAHAGLPFHYPFLDDKVIEACLAVRLHERTTPFVFKPLTVTAMRGTVPDELLARRSKSEFSREIHSGLASRRPELGELLADSHMARLGLVDSGVLRRAALVLYPPQLSVSYLEMTLAVETWLRAHTTSAVKGGQFRC
ncbi:asparagine synthase-related protein [Streptomyces sp. NPDC021096]|uniref:asparagine synthase-related protein n=1 Tax=Streptomyces sp. NPDC021096 TaxID=3154792 RepID=UPI0033DE343B